MEAQIQTADRHDPHENQSTAEAPTANLTFVGSLTAAVYLATLIFYRNGPDAISRTPKQIFACLSVAALLFFYWKGYKIVSEGENGKATRQIILFAGIIAALTFFTFPFHSTDVFGYINRGWQQVHYGQNPYIYTLAEIPDWRSDPMLREHWLYNPNPYGFLFTLMADVICRLGSGNWWLTLGLFKLVNLIAYAATGALVWLGAKQTGQARPDITLYLYLWSPLVLMHCIANGHNDILTGLFLVLAMYLAISKKWFWIIPALAAAALLKYSPGLLIPLAFLLVGRNRSWRIAILSLIAGGLLVAVTSYPYLQDWQHLRFQDIKDNAGLLDNSMLSFLVHIFENLSRVVPPLAPWNDSVKSFLGLVLTGGFAVFLVWQYLTVSKTFDAKAFVRRSLLVLMVLLCIATAKLNGWYFAMVLPVALLVREGDWLRRFTVLVSGSELLSLTFFKQAYIINYYAMIILPGGYIYRYEKISRDTTK